MYGCQGGRIFRALRGCALIATCTTLFNIVLLKQAHRQAVAGSQDDNNNPNAVYYVIEPAQNNARIDISRINKRNLTNNGELAVRTNSVYARKNEEQVGFSYNSITRKIAEMRNLTSQFRMKYFWISPEEEKMRGAQTEYNPDSVDSLKSHAGLVLRRVHSKSDEQESTGGTRPISSVTLRKSRQQTQGELDYLAEKKQRANKSMDTPDPKFFLPKKHRINHNEENYIINQVDMCGSGNSSTPYMVVCVHSLPANREKRDAIRDTWGSIARNHSLTLRMLFLLGVSDGDHVETKLKSENNVYRDIIQGSFKDAYDNLTLKSIMCLRWVTQYCTSAKYVLKTDDDMLVNLPYLTHILQYMYKPKNLILGALNPSSEVSRVGRWAVSSKLYPYNIYPPYCAGASYVISFDAARVLYNISQYFPLLPIEDVHITGILAKVAGIAPKGHPGFAYWSSGLATPCDYVSRKIVSAHHMGPQRLRYFWGRITNSTACRPSPKRRKIPLDKNGGLIQSKVVPSIHNSGKGLGISLHRRNTVNSEKIALV